VCIVGLCSRSNFDQQSRLTQIVHYMAGFAVCCARDHENVAHEERAAATNRHRSKLEPGRRAIWEAVHAQRLGKGCARRQRSSRPRRAVPLSQATEPRAHGKGEVLPPRSPDLLCTSEGCVAEGM